MDFKQTLRETIFLGKQLEICWIHSPKNSATPGDNSLALQHRMPFLRRNLPYTRKEDRKRKSKRGRGLDELFNSEGAEKQPPGESTKGKKVDLLWKCFRYRAKVYNDGFLASPRKATRAVHRTDGIATEKEHTAGKDTQDASASGIKVHDESVGLPMISGSGTTGKQHSMSPLSHSSEENPQLFDLAISSNQLKRERAPAAPRDDRKTIFFDFLYFDSILCLPTIQVERREDRRCPFCNMDTLSDAGIVAHCNDFHGEDLVFRAAMSEDRTLHVIATAPRSTTTGVGSSTAESSRDFVTISTPSSRDLKQVGFVKRPVHKAAAMEQSVRRKKIKLMAAADAKESLESFLPDAKTPIRQYYHSRTFQPMLKGDWDVDSDDEPDDAWLHRMGAELLDDFEDVSPNEKLFMRLWNQFIKCHTVLSDRSIPKRCMSFVRHIGQTLVTHELRQELLLHLFNLWDSGLLSSQHIEACMAEYDKMAGTTAGNSDRDECLVRDSWI